MKKCSTLFAMMSLCFSMPVRGQGNQDQIRPDLGLEQLDPETENLAGLIMWGRGYSFLPDPAVKHGGGYSMRIEPDPVAAEKMFGCGVFRIPANFEGKGIELRGWVKTENVEGGYAGLFMRIDSKHGMNEMDNMKGRGISGTADWQLLTLQLPLARSDESIYFGAILTGTGRMWVDDFQILADGKELVEAPPKPAPDYKAMHDKEFDKGSGLTLAGLSPRQYDDLARLGELWGFLKYYHPAIARGDHNWDYELFRIIPGILASETKDARNQTLLQWIRSLGAVAGSGEAATPENARVKLEPDLGWLESEAEWGAGLAGQLKIIRDARRPGPHYYLEFGRGVGNPIFGNEEPYTTMIYPDPGFRVLALFRYWTIIQYLFPYKNLIQEDWPRVLRESLPEFVQASDALAYRLALLRLIARINDTHANIRGSDPVLEEHRGKYVVPCRVSFVEDVAVVSGLVEGFSGHPFQRGDIIEKVTGEAVQTIVQRNLPLYPASNRTTKLRDIASDLLRSRKETLSVTYSREGRQLEGEIVCVKLIDFYEAMNKETKPSWRKLEQNIGYIYPGTIKNADLAPMMKEFTDTAGIIIDLRCYPSEFIVFSLSEYLQPAPKEFVKFSYTGLDWPGRFVFTPPLAVGRNNPESYKGKLVILVNEMTVSQAEYTAMAFRSVPGAKVIGSTTAGADGNVSPFSLPGGIRTLISGIGVYYPDGTETQGVGIVPDIEVKPTLEGIRAGRDEPLEKAIGLLLEKE